MDFSTYPVAMLVPPAGDAGETAVVHPSGNPRVTLKDGADERPISVWKGEGVTYSRCRFDFLTVASTGAASVDFRLLSCNGCRTEQGIVVVERTLTIPGRITAGYFAGVVRGGVPGLWWVLLGRAQGADVTLGVDAWFDRLGTGEEFRGPAIT